MVCPCAHGGGVHYLWTKKALPYSVLCCEDIPTPNYLTWSIHVTAYLTSSLSKIDPYLEQ